MTSGDSFPFVQQEEQGSSLSCKALQDPGAKCILGAPRRVVPSDLFPREGELNETEEPQNLLCPEWVMMETGARGGEWREQGSSEMMQADSEFPVPWSSCQLCYS